MKNRIKKIIFTAFIIMSVIFMFGCSNKNEPIEISTIENASVSESKSTEKAESKPVEKSDINSVTTSKPSETSAPAQKTAAAAQTTEKTGEKKPADSTTTVPRTTEKAQTAATKPDIRNVCTISIDCETVLNNKDKLNENALKLIPSTGMILPTTEYYIDNENTTVFDVLKKVCADNGIHLEFSYTPAYHSSYIEGIANLYERDCGSLSGWMYSVNGAYPNVGCSEVTVKNGDVIKWRYTCDLGWDVGAGEINQ